MVTVFVHGAGRAGSASWPAQVALDEPGWVFLERAPSGDDADEDADRIAAVLAPAGGGHLVAHSYGANAALLLAQRAPHLVRSIALLEPACFDLARGEGAVEQHVAAMTPVFAVADDPGVTAADFSQRFATAMGTAPPDPSEPWFEVTVSRLRALHPPWDLGLAADLPLAAPVLVLTGGWSDLYEQTASALVRRGARHDVLAGHGHRVQDHPDCSSRLRSFSSEPRGVLPARTPPDCSAS